jgi:hypothetical protein
MKRQLLGIVACATIIALPELKAQKSETRQLASRTELHPIQTLTLSDQQFLNGEVTGAKAATVVGQLRIAQGTGRLPVVVMMHGSGGIDARAETWSRQFHEMGISTFVLDGFTGRGLASVFADQARLGRLNMILDAYRSLDVLATHPSVDF